MKRSLPTRQLREHPDLDQLRRQAKELLEAFIAGDPTAAAEVNAHYRDAGSHHFALHDAQLVLARAYGFDSWPKLKAHVDGVTLRSLVDAVRGNDLPRVRALLKIRPELAQRSIDNLQVLHHAVLRQSPEMVRVLMQHGARAREGVYPHREATSPLTIARERGYNEIVAIINEEERSQRVASDSLLRLIASGDGTVAIARLDADPALIHTSTPEGWTPLHAAARAMNHPAAAWLLDHGAGVNARGLHDLTPLDLAAHYSEDSERFAAIAALLLAHGAELTAPAAVALGDAGWLRARREEGVLVNEIEDTGGLLRIAASHNRPEILALLLEFGLDPDERKRFGESGGSEIVYTWGMPLWHCASTGKHAMAELLLRYRADPNAEVYASGTPLYQAYGRRDWPMVKLLESHGGLPNGTIAGLYRQTELARRLVAGTAGKAVPDGIFLGKPLGEELLWAGACGGDPEVVRMALELVDWPREDPRWFAILEQPLRLWNHSGGHWANDQMDRGTYLTCLRQILERCDPNVRGRTTDREQFGLTILHSVAASRDNATPEERVAFAAAILDAGGRLDLRDNLLKSTPLGWACRWGRIELVKLLLERGADPVERDAEPWATPQGWARKMGHEEIVTILAACLL